MSEKDEILRQAVTDLMSDVEINLAMAKREAEKCNIGEAVSYLVDASRKIERAHRYVAELQLDEITDEIARDVKELKRYLDKTLEDVIDRLRFCRR